MIFEDEIHLKNEFIILLEDVIVKGGNHSE